MSEDIKPIDENCPICGKKYMEHVPLSPYSIDTCYQVGKIRLNALDHKMKLRSLLK